MVDDPSDSSILGFMESEKSDDWLNDSPEQLAQDDAEWDAAFAHNRDKMREMASAATKEYEAGETTPLFNDKGELHLP